MSDMHLSAEIILTAKEEASGAIISLYMHAIHLFFFLNRHTDTLINTKTGESHLLDGVCAAAEDRFRSRPDDCSKTWTSAPEQGTSRETNSNVWNKIIILKCP